MVILELCQGHSDPKTDTWHSAIPHCKHTPMGFLAQII